MEFQYETVLTNDQIGSYNNNYLLFINQACRTPGKDLMKAISHSYVAQSPFNNT